jgi:hypothetical protein
MNKQHISGRYTCNLSTQEAEVKVSRVLGQLEIHNKTLSQNKNKKLQNKTTKQHKQHVK